MCAHSRKGWQLAPLYIHSALWGPTFVYATYWQPFDKKTNVFATGEITTNVFIRQFQLPVRNICGCLLRIRISRGTDLSRGGSPHPLSPIKRFRIHNFRINFQSEDVRVPKTCVLVIDMDIVRQKPSILHRWSLWLTNVLAGCFDVTVVDWRVVILCNLVGRY